MNQHAAQELFSQAEKLFKDARVPEREESRRGPLKGLAQAHRQEHYL